MEIQAPVRPLPQGIKCPLTDEHCAQLNELLRECNTADCIFDALEGIGLDVGAMRAHCAGNRAFGEKTKATFFPDRP